MEILAHRVVWSVLFVALLLAVARNWRFLRELLRRPRALAGICFAALLIAVNWGTYIYGVNSDRVVETALGYFINPLVTVLLGVVVLRERLRAAQWAALGLGGLGGRGAHRRLRPPAVPGADPGVQLRRVRPGQEAAGAAGRPRGSSSSRRCWPLPALGYLGWLAWRPSSTFGQVSAGHTLLLVAAGAATAIPLLLFAGAANRLPMTSLGMLQYLTPILQLGCGVLIYHEPMPPARLAGFTLVWLALIVFTVDAFRATRKRNRAARLEKSAAAVTPA